MPNCKPLGDGPTCVVFSESSASGGPAQGRRCWHTRAEAQHFAEFWLKGRTGWRFEACTHLPAPSRDAL